MLVKNLVVQAGVPGCTSRGGHGPLRWAHNSSPTEEVNAREGSAMAALALTHSQVTAGALTHSQVTADFHSFNVYTIFFHSFTLNVKYIESRSVDFLHS